MVATDVTAEMTETPTTRAVDAMTREKQKTSIAIDVGVATAISEATETETGIETTIGIPTGAHATTKISTQRETEDISDRRTMILVETHGVRRTRVLAVTSTTIGTEIHSAPDLKRALTAISEATVAEAEVGAATEEVEIEVEIVVASEEVVEVVLEIEVVEL